MTDSFEERRKKEKLKNVLGKRESVLKTESQKSEILCQPVYRNRIIFWGVFKMNSRKSDWILIVVW